MSSWSGRGVECHGLLHTMAMLEAKPVCGRVEPPMHIRLEELKYR